MAPQTFAIVGASLAGLRAATALREGGFDGRIALIGEERHLPYDRPPLSKGLLLGSADSASILLAEASYYEDNAIELVLGQRAIALRPNESAVELADGQHVHADKVLLVTGGRARRLSLRGAELEGVHVLRTMDDALAIHAALAPGARVVVIGAGFIGAEVAASARQLGCEVTMIEAAPMPLGRVLGPEICEHYAAVHRARGVNLLTATGVDHIAGERHVTGVVTSTGEEIPADLVVVGIGIEPNVELASAIGLAVDNGIVVDELCATANPAVFAAGDVSSFPLPGLGRHVRFEMWQHAADHGAAAARSMLGIGEPYDPVSWFWSDQYELNLQMAGMPNPSDEIIWRGQLGDSNVSAFYLRDGHLTGVVAINRPKDVRSSMPLINKVCVLTREQLADPAVDIRKAAMAAR